MDTTIYDLDKCECVSSVIKIAPVFGIDNDKMGALGILLKINDGVYVCICSVYSNILKLWTQHEFVYDGYYTTTVKSACQGTITENRRYAPICVLEEKDRKTTTKLKNMLRKFFQDTCIVEYAFQITSREF